MKCVQKIMFKQNVGSFINMIWFNKDILAAIAFVYFRMYMLCTLYAIYFSRDYEYISYIYIHMHTLPIKLANSLPNQS